MNPHLDTEVPAEIARRINIAADQLYEDNGKVTFPNVDTVRRRARVNMNDASAVMRIWRRTQTAAATPLQAAVPESVQNASQALLTTVWAAATSSANANLQTAQAGWEQERTEAEACRQQLATAFDDQTEELALAQLHINEVKQHFIAKEVELQTAATTIEELWQRVTIADGKVATAEARTSEVVQRISDLKSELALAHASNDQERRHANERLDAANLAITNLREDLHKKFEEEQGLREELAHLRGQAEAMVAERKNLLANWTSNVHVASSAKRTTANKSKPPNGK